MVESQKIGRTRELTVIAQRNLSNFYWCVSALKKLYLTAVTIYFNLFRNSIFTIYACFTMLKSYWLIYTCSNRTLKVLEIVNNS